MYMSLSAQLVADCLFLLIGPHHSPSTLGRGVKHCGARCKHEPFSCLFQPSAMPLSAEPANTTQISNVASRRGSTPLLLPMKMELSLNGVPNVPPWWAPEISRVRYPAGAAQQLCQQSHQRWNLPPRLGEYTVQVELAKEFFCLRGGPQRKCSAKCWSNVWPYHQVYQYETAS